MNDRNLVELHGVSVRYRLARHRPPSFKEFAIHWVRGALTYEELWALRGIDLELERGECLGIVGRNGAGKSTLLKVISGILKPVEGTVAVRGSVAPILELGAGFDHELSGRENIFLNALLLGHRQREIERKLDEIVDFSGLGDFIEAPTRSYSSGMQARLGFAIASAWQPDVLILDEVFAVGDREFTQKCLRRLDELRQAGSSLLLVTHDLELVRSQCQRGMVLEQGRVLLEGRAEAVVDGYLELVGAPTAMSSGV